MTAPVLDWKATTGGLLPGPRCLFSCSWPGIGHSGRAVVVPLADVVTQSFTSLALRAGRGRLEIWKVTGRSIPTLSSAWRWREDEAEPRCIRRVVHRRLSDGRRDRAVARLACKHIDGDRAGAADDECRYPHLWRDDHSRRVSVAAIACRGVRIALVEGSCTRSAARSSPWRSADALPIMTVEGFLKQMIIGSSRHREAGSRPRPCSSPLYCLPLRRPGIASGLELRSALSMTALAAPLLIGGSRFKVIAQRDLREALAAFNCSFASAVSPVVLSWRSRSPCCRRSSLDGRQMAGVSNSRLSANLDWLAGAAGRYFFIAFLAIAVSISWLLSLVLLATAFNPI